MGEHDGKDSKDSKDSKDPKLTEALKKVFAVGVTAAFMTEESVRAYLSDLKLPKEILNLLLQGASKTKEEIANRVSNELVSIVHKVDLVKEFARFAEDHKFKITAEVEILKRTTKPDQDRKSNPLASE